MNVNIKLCEKLGLVKFPEHSLGFTQKGLPRTRRHKKLTPTEYSRERIKRIIKNEHQRLLAQARRPENISKRS